MLTARRGLVAVGDAAPFVGIYVDGNITGVFIPSGQVNSIIIRDAQTAYFTVRGDGLYKGTVGWSIWTQMVSGPDLALVGVHGSQIFLNRGKQLQYFGAGQTFINANGIVVGDSIYDAAFISSSICFTVSHSRLYKSFDGGANWQTVLDTLVRAESLYYDSTHKLLYIGGKQPLQSADSGKTFVPVQNIFFFSTAGQILGARDCSGTFYIGPDSTERIEMLRSTSQAKFIQEVGVANFSSYRYLKTVILDRGSTFFWLDKSGLLSVSRNGLDGTIPEQVEPRVLLYTQDSITNSTCPSAKATNFTLNVRYDDCTGIVVDSFLAAKPNKAFTIPQFVGKFIADSTIMVSCAFRAQHTGDDSVEIRMVFHSLTTGLTETKKFIVRATGYADVPIYSASAEAISFGEVKVGRKETRTLTISNIGCDTLLIDSLESSFPAYFSFTAPKYPVRIPTQKSFALDIDFTPHEEGDYLESLAIRMKTGSRYITLVGKAYKTDTVSFVKENNKKNIIVYPNPSRGTLNVQGPLPEQIVIRNVLGAEIKRIDTYGSASFDISDLPDGVYSIDLGNIMQRIVLLRR